MAEAQMSLYDYAKQVISKEVPMKENILEEKLIELGKYISSRDYTMLLCNERRDFTIFHNNKKDFNFSKNELKETIFNRGTVLLIDEQPGGAYEIWIRGPLTGDNFAYYLFDYSNAIVEV